MQDVESQLPVSEVVRLRPPSRSVRYLLHVRKEACACCPTGRRVISVWATGRGTAEELSWCDRCFNAECLPVEFPEAHRNRYAAIRARVARRNLEPAWSAARPALSDLERRGLL